MNVLKVLWRGLLNAQKIIMIFCSIMITVAIAVQASFRYFFSIDFFGFEEVIVIMAFWLYFAGATYGSYDGSHIKADIIPTYIKNIKIRKIVMLVVSFVTLSISLLFAYWSFEYVMWVAQSGATTSVLKIPVIFSRGAVLLGFIFMSFYFIVHFVEDIISFIKVEIKGEEEVEIDGGENI